MLASYAVAGCNMDPEIINLFQYGASIGDTIQITEVGGLCVYSGAGCQVYSVSSGNYLGAIFSMNGVVDAASGVNRVEDPVGTILPDITSTVYDAFANGQNTTTPDDFYAATTVVVAAQYLIVGTLDSAFADNSLGTCNPVTTECFGVNITDLDPSSTAPEPGSAALLLTGIGGLWAFRRKFVKQA